MPTTEATAQPLFSVVVPTYRRPDALTALLTSLREQCYPRERFEVVIINDDGGHAIDDVVAAFRAALDITLLDVAHGGCAAARQAGVMLARGRWIAFTDDDCRPAPDWLAQLERSITVTPGCAIGGTVVNALTRNLFSEATQWVLDSLDSRLNAGGAVRFLPTNNLSFPADDLRAVGGLDATWPMLAAGEDRELCARWTASGRRIVRSHQCVVNHHHPLNARSFVRQHYFYGRGARFFREHLGWTAPPLEPPGFYLRLPFTPILRGGGTRGIALSVLLVVAQAANALGYLRQAIAGSSHAGNG